LPVASITAVSLLTSSSREASLLKTGIITENSISLTAMFFHKVRKESRNWKLETRYSIAEGNLSITSEIEFPVSSILHQTDII
jgi:hypothetical protein